MLSSSDRARTPERADLVLRIGAIVTAVGLAFTLVAIVPLIAPSVSMPSELWFLSMLTGVGLVIVFVGLVMSARSRRAH
jgi:VIT1/CCC1 family predicted Fe2+/Mn2+ transporter